MASGSPIGSTLGFDVHIWKCILYGTEEMARLAGAVSIKVLYSYISHIPTGQVLDRKKQELLEHAISIPNRISWA